MLRVTLNRHFFGDLRPHFTEMGLVFGCCMGRLSVTQRIGGDNPTIDSGCGQMESWDWYVTDPFAFVRD